MPQAKPKSYDPCPEGDDILALLVAVEESVNDANSQFNPGGIRWKWRFETLELTDEKDVPYSLTYYTGTEYIAGSPRCKLTKLLDKIAKNLTPDERAVIDTDELVNKKYKLDVTHVTRQDGSTGAQIDSIKRIWAKAESTPEPAAKPTTKKKAKDEEDDEEDDPYKEE